MRNNSSEPVRHLHTFINYSWYNVYDLFCRAS